jgi:hypothetical protein
MLLIAAACIVAGVKLHSQGAFAPMAATRELNRCIAFVSAAAARKGSKAHTPQTRDCPAERAADPRI